MKILIGGAWPYANYKLHLGHIAGLVGGDVLARYHRAKGDDVIYVSGSDCHGTPIIERAKKEGITPKDVCEKYHANFVKAFNGLNFSYDLYTLTNNKNSLLNDITFRSLNECKLYINIVLNNENGNEVN